MTGDSDETRAVDTPAWSLRLAEGTVLSSRYRLGSQIGRGGMGVIYRATDLELRREVAVKILLEAGSSANGRERLLREARAAATLNHPHIVAVHDVGEDHGVPFLVMELVAGSSLGHQRLSNLHDIIGIGIQVCEALEHAHTHHIVHRDLKPENILMVGEGVSGLVKLADLGLAVPPHESRGSEVGTIVGTVNYMAPEQAMGEAVDGRTDLYALGAVLYELTTGRVPFQGDHPLGIVSQHVNAPVVPPRALRADLPRPLDAAILKLLAKDPSQRFPTARQAADALGRCLDASGARLDEPGAAVAILDALSRGRLVGRTTELAQAIELWRRACDGLSHGLLLSGEPGAGKTRLARELMTQAGLDGAIVLTGACYEFDATTPYLPFAEAFRRWLGDQANTALLRGVLGPTAPMLGRLVPDIEARLGPFDQRPEIQAHEERLLFFDAVALAFRGLARSRGLLFYVDDLHWADNGTLWLFGHLFRNLRDARVLMVASYRESELARAHPLSKALVEWNRERLTTRMVLRRLGLEGTRAQLAALLGESVGDAFGSALHRETEGNPFFVEEMLKALIEQGSVRRESGRWTHSEVGDLQLPQSMKAAIGRRLERMSPQTNDVLRAAAILGKTFDFSELAAAAGDRDEDALLDALDEAVAAQLLVPGRGESFAFTHDKIREVLYEELNPIRRRRLHLRTAEGLEHRREGRTTPVEKLAHHYIEAGEHEHGLRYATEAGADATRMFAYEEALAAYGRALECAEVLGRRGEQGVLEETMGEVCLVSGNLIAALGHFERALGLATDPFARARLQCQAAHSLVVVGDPRGLHYLHEACEVLTPETHPLEATYARSIEARFHHLAGRHRQAIDLLEQAVVLVSPETTRATITGRTGVMLIQIYGSLAGAHQHLGLFADGDRWARRAIDFGQTYGFPASQALGYEFLAENAAMSGNWSEGLEYMAKEREIAARIHSRERLAWTHMSAGMCSMGLGDRERAESELRTGVVLAASIGEKRLEVLLASLLAVAVADRGSTREALEIGRDACNRAETLGLSYQRTEARRSLAQVHFLRNELEDALRLCDEVVDLTEGHEPKVSRLLMGPMHVEALLASGRLDDARAAAASYRRLAGECQSPKAVQEAARLEALVG